MNLHSDLIVFSQQSQYLICKLFSPWVSNDQHGFVLEASRLENFFRIEQLQFAANLWVPILIELVSVQGKIMAILVPFGCWHFVSLNTTEFMITCETTTRKKVILTLTSYFLENLSNKGKAFSLFPSSLNKVWCL